MVRQQEEPQDVDLHVLSADDALDRSVRNTVGRDVAGIAYAKSMGRTAEDFGRFVGDLTAVFWTDIKGKGPAAFVRHLHRFLQTDRGLKLEILSASTTVVKARHTVYGATTIQALACLGVTVDEYTAYYGTQFGAVAAALGLDYQQHVDGDWTVLTLSDRH